MKNIVTDNLVMCPDSQENDILSEVKKFWDSASIFKKFGYLHRRGIVLYGAPGTGKTSLINLITVENAKRNGVVFFCDGYPKTFIQGLKAFREVEPDRPIICLFEDLEEIMDNYGHRALLSLLDGEDVVDHVLNIATTNFVTRLDNRIIGRPRRFDRKFEISMPKTEARRNYLQMKFGDKLGDELETFVEATEELSFAALADTVIQTQCLGMPLMEAVNSLRKLQGLQPKGEPALVVAEGDEADEEDDD
jgi:SpoVK/Ycf46/Vps4 family AAA+-type ATPase